MAAPLHELPAQRAGQSLRVLLWERDLVDMWMLDEAGGRLPFRGRGSVWHAHADCELTCITAGEGVLQVGDHSGAFAAPDCLLLGPELPHVWKARGATAGISIQFRPEGGPFAAPELADCAELWRAALRGLRWRGDTAAALRAGLAELAGCGALERLARFLALLALLRRGHPQDAQPLSVSAPAAAAGDGAQRRMGRVLDHLLERYAEPVRVADLVRLAGCSPATFNRRFARLTGTSVVGYVHRLRVQEVQRRLLESDDTITAIAFACGFENLSHVNAVFRRHAGTTPSAYRRRAQG